jgi:cysteine-rich repeat protein
MPVTTTIAGDLESVSIYHNGATGSLLLGIYADDGGLPGTRLGVTAVTALNSSQGWQTVPLTSLVSVSAGQDIWLAWASDVTPGIRYQSGSPGRAASGVDWSGSNDMPTDFGSSSIASYQYSIYATYSGGGGTCGDGTLDAGEECDDGNTVSGDGCSSTCTLEGGGTIGNTDVYSDVSTAGNRRAQQVTATGAGDLQSISIYHDSGGSGGLLLAIYEDNNDAPGNRLGVTSEVQISSSAGWVTVDLVSPVSVTSGQKVWLAWVFENNPGVRNEAGTPGRAQSSETWSSGMPTSFGSSSFSNYIYSIYATYAP